MIFGCSVRKGAPVQSGPAPARAPEASAAPDAGVAVVELFTSESCSSCPPAEANLARIVAKRDPKHVIALSFHVDYWNQLGWTDPFSSPDYTARQRNYANHGAGGVYTPELFVNGAQGMVGSNVTRSDAALDTALSTPPAVSVDLALDAGDGISGHYAVSSAPRSAVMDLALLQRSAVNPVTGGENAGQTLHQVDVVRSFRTLELNGASGTFTFALPKGLSRSDVRVAAFVQDPTTLHILGGAATP